MNVPEKIPTDLFRKLKDKLNDDAFQKYQHVFTAHYRENRSTQEYTLREDTSEEVRVIIDFILKRLGYNNFSSINDLAIYFRKLLDEKKYIVLFANNGTGKTRLSMEFRALGQSLDPESGEKTADTLYFNAFTEDLFHWDNDLDNDTERLLKLNINSRFFRGLHHLEMESKIRPLLQRYVDFDFRIDYENAAVHFFREDSYEQAEDIKVSRGEERIFIWCFFLAILQLAIDREESYQWVKYVYIDDPISSLDDNNAITVATHLIHMTKETDKLKFIISSHHTLFFNVICNQLKKAEQLFLQWNAEKSSYILKNTASTPFFHHVSLLRELKRASDTGELYTYHFNILRSILEKTASFHGHKAFSSCIQFSEKKDLDVYTRIVNLLSHGNYSLFDPKEMIEENKQHFRTILNNFISNYHFNHEIFEEPHN